MTSFTANSRLSEIPIGNQMLYDNDMTGLLVDVNDDRWLSIHSDLWNEETTKSIDDDPQTDILSITSSLSPLTDQSINQSIDYMFSNFEQEYTSDYEEGMRGKELTEITEDQKPTLIKLDTIDQQQLTSRVVYTGDVPNYEIRISNACVELNIVDNPFLWTAEEVKVWCDWALRNFQVNDVRRYALLKNIDLEGSNLCQFQREDFIRLFQKSGDYVYSELELWKNARALLSPEIISTSLVLSSAAVPTRNRMIATSDSMTSSKTSSSEGEGNIPTIVLDSVLTDTPMDDQSNTTMATDRCYFPSIELRTDCYNSRPLSADTISADDITDSGISLSCEFTTLSQTRLMGSGDEESNPSDSQPWQHHYSKQGNHLWQFLQELLQQPSLYGDCIRWLDRHQGIFKIEESVRVAKLWGERKNRPAMNYDKLSRSIRQYYKKGIIKKTSQSKRLVYQFCSRYTPS